MTKPGRPQGTTKSFPLRMQPETYERLHHLASNTGLTLGTALQQLLTHGGTWVAVSQSMSTELLSGQPKDWKTTSEIFGRELELRQEADNVIGLLLQAARPEATAKPGPRQRRRKGSSRKKGGAKT